MPEPEDPKETTSAPEDQTQAAAAPVPTAPPPAAEPRQRPSIDDRFRSQSEAHTAEIEALKAAHAKELADLKAAHEKLMAQLKTALGLGGDEPPDPAEIARAAETRAQTSERAARKQAFTVQAIAQGIPPERVDAAFKLADVTGIAIDGEGNATGADAVVTALLAKEGYLRAPGKPSIGTPTSPEPADESDPFAAESMRDGATVRKNKAKILERLRASVSSR